MATQDATQGFDQASTRWLKSYYFIRFAVSAAWVALAFTVARHMPALAAIMLVAYPAWDAIANFIDAQNTGGLRRNKSQFLNFVISVLTSLAVGIALTSSMNAVLTVYGVWAFVSGLLQLTTAARRWKTSGAQWAMILSGAQSALAGAFFVKMASDAGAIDVTNIAPYAAFGAFYFLVSAVQLTLSDIYRKSPQVAR